MKIGIIDIEPKVVNTAYMQISDYYKYIGYNVEWWAPLTDSLFDKVYCSSLFDFTDKSEVPKRALRGGTGYDVSTKLPDAITACEYDYSIYPECDYSVVWFSRGCIRNCPFCVVPKKEGKIYSAKPKTLNPRGKYLMVFDNNFFANPQWKEAIPFIESAGQKIIIQQGIDVRLVDEYQIDFLRQYHIMRANKVQIKIAWDDPRMDIVPYIKTMLKKIAPHHIECYVLIGYWSSPEEDMHRIKALSELNINPYVMPFDKTDQYQKAFARWVNGRIIKSCPWQEYKYNPANKGSEAE